MPGLGSISLLLLASLVQAQRTLYSNSFQSCQSNNSLTATSFDASLTPDNRNLRYFLNGATTYSGNATIAISISVNEETIFSSTFDPCVRGIAGFCPSNAGPIMLNVNTQVPSGSFDGIPNTTYTMTNPDAYFRFYLNNSATGRAVGCLQANLTNDASRTMPGSNTTNSTNTTGSGSGNQSAASTAYLNWTLFA